MRSQILLLSILAMFRSAASAQSLGTELVVNGDFEAPLNNGSWTAVAGSVGQLGYGTRPTAPSTAVAQAMGGLNFMAEQTAGSTAVIRQEISLSSQTAAINAGSLDLVFSASLGGFDTDPDDAEARAVFLNALGAEIFAPGRSSSLSLGYVEPAHRNNETVLVACEERTRVPAGAVTLRIEVVFRFLQGANGTTGYADNLSAILTASTPPAPAPLDTELLVNGDFESGWVGTSPLVLDDPAGWRGRTGRFESVGYGGGFLPDGTVRSILAGGSGVLRAAGSGVLWQSLDLRGNSSAIQSGALWVEFSADLGGYATDQDLMQFRLLFFDGMSPSANLLSTSAVHDVDVARRNAETVLLRQLEITVVPAGTERIDVEVTSVFQQGSSGANGLADNLSVKLLAAQSVPPLPVATNLLQNSGFDGGWIPASPLDLASGAGWVGAGSTTMVDRTGPSPKLRDGSGGGLLVQQIDLTPNAAAIQSGNLWLELGADLGGATSDPDQATVSAKFFDRAGNPALPVGLPGPFRIGPIAPEDRNNESTLLRVVDRVRIPIAAATLVVEIDFDFLQGAGGANGCVDNVTASLETAGPRPVPLQQDLLVNGDFESGWVQGSPLVPGSVGSWRGFGGVVAVVQAGAGNHELEDRTGGGLQRVIDLRGHATALNQGFLRLFVEGDLGATTAQNRADLTLEFVDATGARLVPVANVGSSSSYPMSRHSLEIAVPPGAVAAHLQLAFTLAANPPSARADDLRCVLFDTRQGGPAAAPGTGEDLAMFTGRDAASLSSGPGYDRKSIAAGDVVLIRTDSPDGTFDFEPLMLVVQPTATVLPPTPTAFLPGVQLDLTQSITLVDGNVSNGVFGPPRVWPAGFDYVLRVPPFTAGQGFSLHLQAAVLSSLATNGFYATTDRHELVIR